MPLPALHLPPTLRLNLRTWLLGLSLLTTLPLLVFALSVVWEFKEFQQRTNPEVAGFGSASGAVAQSADFHLVGGPVSTRGGPGIGDLILDLGRGVEAKVLGCLM